jgi:hypothetical protein
MTRNYHAGAPRCIVAAAKHGITMRWMRSSDGETRNAHRILLENSITRRSLGRKEMKGKTIIKTEIRWLSGVEPSGFHVTNSVSWTNQLHTDLRYGNLS